MSAGPSNGVQYDGIVIGGGPSGATTARELARSLVPRLKPYSLMDDEDGMPPDHVEVKQLAESVGV